MLAHIRGLSLEQLEMLLEFSEAADVKAWMEQQAEGGSESLSDEDISQQRRIEGEVAWIREKLKERLGEIDVTIKRLRELSLKQLEALSEDFLTFPRAENTVAWLFTAGRSWECAFYLSRYSARGVATEKARRNR